MIVRSGLRLELHARLDRAACVGMHPHLHKAATFHLRRFLAIEPGYHGFPDFPAILDPGDAQFIGIIGDHLADP